MEAAFAVNKRGRGDAKVDMFLALVLPAAAQAAPPPLLPDARFALALYCNPTCDETVLNRLDEGLAAIRARDGFAESVTRSGRIMGIAGPEFGIPDAEFIATYGVGVEQPEALAASQQVVLAWFASPREEAIDILRAAHAAFRDAATLAKGWVEDLDTQRIYGPTAWAQLDPVGPMTAWFVVDAMPADPALPDGNLRLLTRGLRRYGDAELVVEDVAPDAAADISVVINAVAETLRPRTSLPTVLTIATRTVNGTARFSEGRTREDDPEPPLVQLNFEGDIAVPPAPADPVPPPPIVSEPQVASTGPLPAPDAPATLAEAQTLALARFDTVVRGAWDAGLPAGAAIAVSIPFPTSKGAREYMWVELRSWTGDQLTGVLMNAPNDVPERHLGDVVTVPRSDVFDYIWKKGDGAREGNTTIGFLQ